MWYDESVGGGGGGKIKRKRSKESESIAAENGSVINCPID